MPVHLHSRMYRDLSLFFVLVLSSVMLAQGTGYLPPNSQMTGVLGLEPNFLAPTGAGYRPMPNEGPMNGGPMPNGGPTPPLNRQGEMPDLAPTEEVISPGPSMYSVDYWLTPTLWEGSVELGINGTEGNAQSFSIRTGGDLTRKTDSSKTEVDLTYAKTSSGSVETQHNAIFNAQHDWLFKESPWSVFVRTGLIYDEFRAFDLRFALNAGLGYEVYRTKISKFATRVGSGVSREFGGPDDSWVPEGVLGADYERRISKKQKINAKIDYFPDWGDWMDYRIVAEANWEVMLDEDPNLSLKIGVIDRYDSTPNGLKPNNIDYTVLLLWKL